MVKGGSVYSAQRTKPGTLLGGRKEQSQASYDDKTVDMLLDLAENTTDRYVEQVKTWKSQRYCTRLVIDQNTDLKIFYLRFQLV